MPGRFAGHEPSRLRRGVAVMVALGVQGLLMLLVPRLPGSADEHARQAVAVRLVASPPQRPRAVTPASRTQAVPAAARVAPAGAADSPTPVATPAMAATDLTAPSPESAAPPAAPRLNLALPGRELVERRSPGLDVRTAALNDPRANTVKPRFDERLALATGNAECVIATRQPDGSTLRRFGRIVYLETLHAAATNVKDLVPVCVE